MPKVLREADRFQAKSEEQIGGGEVGKNRVDSFMEENWEAIAFFGGGLILLLIAIIFALSQPSQLPWTRL